MARKDDLDNRSNQLNPNNDAYYSSRGLSRDDGVDDAAEGVQVSYIRPLRNTYRTDAIEFRAGVTSFSGNFRALRFDVITSYDSAFFGAANNRRLDAEDFAERILNRLSGALSAKWNDRIAFSALFNESGDELVWITREYDPAGYTGRTRENDRAWLEVGQFAAQAIRAQLSAPHPVLDDIGCFMLGRSIILSKEHDAQIINFISLNSG